MTRNKKQRNTRSFQQPATINAAPHHQDWKSNPVMVAAGSAAATVLLCIAVVTQVVIPTQTAKLEIDALKAKELSRNLQLQLDAQTKSGVVLEKEMHSLRKERAELGRQLLEMRAGDLFRANDPYPKGLGVVRVGTPISQLLKNFREDQIEQDEDRPNRMTVRFENSPIRYAIYNFEKNDPRKLITSISFLLGYGNKFDETFLRRKLTEALGDPIEHPEKDFYRWRNSSSVSVYMLDSDSYIIMSPRFEPAIWPE